MTARLSRSSIRLVHVQELLSRVTRLFGPSPDIGRHAFWIGFALIGVVGAALRFWNLGGTALWMDEAVTAGLARLPVEAILFGKIDNHPSLSYLVQHFWMSLGADPSLIRAPTAIAGSLSVLIVMLAGKDLVSRSTGLAFGLLFALSTGQIYYSQDLRMYPYLVLGLVIAVWGGVGMARTTSATQKRYLALYILGGAIAIYSHVLGLVAMAMVGVASLVSGLLTPNRLGQARAWLFTNIVLFIVVLPWLLFLPAAMGSFPGLPRIALLDFHWHLRAAVGYPGLSELSFFQLALETALYGMVTIGAFAAWRDKRHALALTTIGLAIAYPLIVTGLQLLSPIMHVRAYLPAGIGVVLGAGLGAMALRPAHLRWSVLGALALISAASSINELKHHNKLEDYRSGFAYADQRGYSEAPILSCYDFSASAMWEERRNASIFLVLPDGVMRFPGQSYWRLVEGSIMSYRAMTAQQKDDYLGGGLLVEGGLEEALRGSDRALFMEGACLNNLREELPRMMAGLGFVVEEHTRITGRASKEVMLEAPVTKLTLFVRRPAEGASAAQ